MSHTFARRNEPQPVERLIRTRDDHTRIIASMRQGDPVEARKTMAQHFAAGRALRLEMLERERSLSATRNSSSSWMLSDEIQTRLRAIELDGGSKTINMVHTRVVNAFKELAKFKANGRG